MADASAPPPRRQLTPIWTLKASQLLGAAAFACLGKYLPVYYADIDLERSLIGTLGFVGMGTTFFGQLFWSAVIDYLGEYKSVLVFTQFFGTCSLFLYCLPVVKGNIILIFAVAISNTFLMSTGGSIIDALCMRVLADYKMALRPDSTPRTVRGAQQSYGDTRLFSAVGWGGMSMIMGQIIDTLGINFMFIGFALIQAVNVSIVVFFMPSPSKEQVAQDAAKAAAEEAAEVASEGGSQGNKLCNVNVMWFFANLLMYGVAMCLSENFLFVYLVEDFENTPNLVLGVSTAVMCAFEIPVFKYLGPYLEKQPEGDEKVITLVLFACQAITAVRCWMYSAIPKDFVWLAVAISPLHGICFAAMWGASMEYAKRLSGKRNLAKMTSLVNGIYYNVSMGVGSVIWGVLVEPESKGGLGFVKSFQVDIWFMVAWSIVWQIGLFFLSRRSARAPELSEGLAGNA